MPNVIPPPPAPCPPGYIPWPVAPNQNSDVICLRRSPTIRPFASPLTPLSRLGGRAKKATAPCLNLIFTGISNPGGVNRFGVFVGCGPLNPGQCVTARFAMDQNVGATGRSYLLRLLPPNTQNNQFPREQWPSGFCFFFEFSDTLAGSRYRATQNNCPPAVTLTKDGAPVGSPVSIGSFVNGPNQMGTPTNTVQPSPMFPGQFFYLHGSQVSEFNTSGVFVATRLLQFMEVPRPLADFLDISGSVTFCNNTGSAISPGTLVADLVQNGPNFRQVV